MRKATEEDFRVVDHFIDLLAPAYCDEPEIKRGRKAWARILLTYGSCKRPIEQMGVSQREALVLWSLLLRMAQENALERYLGEEDRQTVYALMDRLNEFTNR